MSFSFIGLLLVPLIVGGFFYLTDRRFFSTKEFVLLEVVMLSVMWGGFYLAKSWTLSSTEIWHGRITAKNRDTISCCHCHEECVSKNKDGTCASSVTKCDHSFDYEWSLHVSSGDDVVIETCDGWGGAPTAWSKAQIDEPAAVEHSYTNYLLADPNSLFTKKPDFKKFEKILPKQPEVFGHYKIDKVLYVGDAPQSDRWNVAVRDMNADLGKKLQIDVMVVVTSNPDPSFAEALEAKWLFGPKNSFTIVLGVLDNQIAWARAFTISRVEDLKIEIRDGLPGKEFRNLETIAMVRNLIETHYHRRPLKDFEYLESLASPSTGYMVLLYIFALAGSIGLGMYFRHKDVFGDERWDRN